MKDTELLLDFLASSPTPFHVVANLAERLKMSGFKRLYEKNAWQIQKPGLYFVTRNDSSMFAIRYGQNPARHGFRLVGAHTDSPCLKIKPDAITCNNGYAKLALEVYGGALLNPWFDRDLGVAGRVMVKTEEGALVGLLVCVRDPVAFIPSLAIHLDRKANENKNINKQKHLPAILLRTDSDSCDFQPILLSWLNSQHPEVRIKNILSFELFLFDCQMPSLVGYDRAFIASARLDNLLSCHAAIEALLATGETGNHVVILNDHEEVGSRSTSGAAGSFLDAVLRRFCGSEENMQRAMDHSMLVSADNAHGIHPNFPDLHEPAHQPLINEGPVIKINHNQNYATNSESEGVFRAVCEHNEIKCQTVVVRSDMECGSTIGPITATRLGVRTVDVGVPQLGMHSIRELAGVDDQPALKNALKGFFEFKNWPF